jgi:hypothetical protein
MLKTNKLLKKDCLYKKKKVILLSSAGSAVPLIIHTRSEVIAF